MRILVLGHGFIGKALVKKLNKDSEITVFAKSFNEKIDKVNYIQGDLLDLNLLYKVVKKKDVILHVNGVTGIEKVRKNESLSCKLNIANLLNILGKVCYTQKFIYLSSSASIECKSFYGVQKRLAEMLVRGCQEKSIVLRVFNAWGDGQSDKQVVGRFMKLKKQKKSLEIWGTGETIRDFVHIDDVVEACIRAIDCRRPGLYEIGSGVGTSIKQLAESVGGKINFIEDKRRGLQDEEKIADITLAKKHFRWKPTKFISELNAK